jgi:hypothetical protein
LLIQPLPKAAIPQSIKEEEDTNLSVIPEFADVTLHMEPITAEKLKNTLKGFKSIIGGFRRSYLPMQHMFVYRLYPTPINGENM